MLRPFSSAATSGGLNCSIRELKRHIHRLYKHIHPDRLTGFPEQRVINEASFQVLQSALDRHFNPSEATTTTSSTPSTKLTFFARTDNYTGLSKAVITFHESRLASALQDIFAGLGLDPPPQDLLLSLVPTHVRHSLPRLRDLVERARRSRSFQSDTYTAQTLDDATVSRLTTQRACGIHLNICNSVPVHAQAAAAKRVRDVLTSSAVDTRGIEVTVDGGASTTIISNRWTPHVTLGILASKRRWHDTLTSAAFNAVCTEARNHRSALREAEKSAASALGVRLVLCSTDVHGEVDDKLLVAYARVIEDISANGKEFGGNGFESWRSSLAVMISAGSKVEMDVENGLLHVGVDLGANGVDKIVGSCKWVSKAFEERRDKKEADWKMVEDTRRMIGAARLGRHDELTQTEWEDGLRALRRRAGVLRDMLSGVSVLIGVRPRVNEKGEVEIPYNFEKQVEI